MHLMVNLRMIRKLLLLNIAVVCCFGWTLDSPDASLAQTNTFIEFVYYTTKIPWLAARRTCQSLGGDLAKIDSKQTLDTIKQLASDNYGYNIFEEEYWIGLLELENNEHFWVSDCSNLTYQDKYPQNFKNDEVCYRLKKDDSSEKKQCSGEEGFMCEVFSGKPCYFSTVLSAEVLFVVSNTSSCLDTCSGDLRCWGTVEYIPDNCVALALPGYGVQGLNLATKFCYNVTLNTTTISKEIPDNTNRPNVTCGSLVITATPSSSILEPVSSIYFTTCEPVNITHNVTVISTQLETSTTSFTTTEHSTHTSTESHTSTSVSTSTTTTTSVDTEYVYINSTYTVTSTVHMTATQNITTEQAEEIAQEIVKNLTIDAKSTSSHTRRLTSAQDKRQSAMFVGYVGIIFVIVPLGLMLIVDLRKLYMDFRSHEHIYKK